MQAVSLPPRSEIVANVNGSGAHPRIATEEAFTTSAVAAAYRQLLSGPTTALDAVLLRLIYTSGSESGESRARDTGDRDARARTLLPLLLDVGDGRLSSMDASGVTMQVLSLASPGVQMFSRDVAVGLSAEANDELTEVIAKSPSRFAGLATIAPQDPLAAVRELDRAVRELGLRGVMINSHTDGMFLDDPRYWPILEAIEALGVPLYLHPRAPGEGMAAGFCAYRMEGAIWGYGVEAGTHAVRLMLSGVLDRFPKLRVVLGHLGEALPFWLWRLDYMAAPRSRNALRNELKPSEYFRRNFAITTSGVEDASVLHLGVEKIGVENVMWAVDYPYQSNAPAVDFLENAPLSSPNRAAIFGGNARRIFGIADAVFQQPGEEAKSHARS